jgi:hypothetical protein
MWDSPSNGTFINCNRENKEILEKLKNLPLDKLKKLVFLYTQWESDSYLDSLHIFIANEIKGHFSRNTISGFEEDMQICDAACREIARRWVKGKLLDNQEK